MLRKGLLALIAVEISAVLFFAAPSVSEDNGALPLDQGPPTGSEAVSGDPPDSLSGEIATFALSANVPGVSVVLKDKSRISGETPFEIMRFSEGYYKVHASKKGYERQSGEINVLRGLDGRWRVKVHSPSKIGVMLRSALWPGLGQLSSGEKVKGIVLGIVEVGAVAVVAVTDHRYRRSVDRYETALSKYNNAIRVEDIEEHRKTMLERSSELENNYDRRSIALGAASAVWAISALDVLMSSYGARPDIQDNALSFDLRPKTRWRAALRSLLIPGWGQYYSGNKGKGLCFGLVQMISATSVLLTHEDYDAKVEDYTAVQEKYLNAETLYDIEKYRQEMLEESDKVDQAYRGRQLALGLGLGLWGYNILDSIISFKRYIPEQENPSVTLFARNNTVGVTYSF